MRRPRRPVTAPPEEPPRTVALRLLGRRDLTRVELAARLSERGYTAAAIDAALDDLVRIGAVDDRRAAEAHVRTASRIKGRGKLRIRRELEARGLSAVVIQDALGQVPADADRDAIARFLARKAPDGHHTPADRRRLFQQLLRRGFPSDLIARALSGSVDD